MANCNECGKLDIVVEKDETGTNINHICSKHNITLRYAPKRFRGYIWPCVECNDNDFVKMKGKK